MTTARDGLARSVQVRLAQHAKEIGIDPNLVLTRYAVERFLYRLSRSRHGDQFVLKGALLLLVWFGEALRPTRDADLLGFGDLSDENLLAIVSEVCDVEVEPDAVSFDRESIALERIRPEDDYGGRRVTLRAQIGAARLRVQIDIGVGDVVTPEAMWLDYPGLLNLPGPRLRGYTPQTVVAEKFHAMVVLGSKNSRMRDFFDVDAISAHTAFEGAMLDAAIRATFERRKTPVPGALPLALTAEFAGAADKQAQWKAFVAKIRGRSAPAPAKLEEVVARLAAFLGPVITALAASRRLDATWPPGGPWVTP